MRKPVKLEAPVFFLPERDGWSVDAVKYLKLLTYCFPWIHIMCRVPLPDRPLNVNSTIMSSHDLKCCDSFFFDFVDSGRDPAPNAPGDTLLNFEWIPKHHGLLSWFAMKSRTLCSGCGWTGGAARGPLTTNLVNASLHLLIYELGVYTRLPEKKRVRLSEVSTSFGTKEGFERAFVNHVARKYNFKLLEQKIGPIVKYGSYPDRDLSIANRTIITRLLSRQFHMIYGSVTLGPGRLKYSDFSSALDFDHLTAASKVTESKHSFASLAEASCIFFHVCLPMALALFSLRGIRRRKFSTYIENSINMVFRPVHPYGSISRGSSLDFPAKFVSTVHAVCAMVLSALLSGVLITILSQREFFGFFDSESDILEALAEPGSLALLDENVAELFGISSGGFMKEVWERHTPCVNAFDDCLQACRNTKARTCLNFGQAGALTDALLSQGDHKTMRVCTSIGYSVLQGFMFPKGCFLSQIISREIQRASEQHLLERFKVNAGMERYELRKKSTTAGAVSSRTFRELTPVYWCSWAVAASSLLIENLLARIRNSFLL